MLYYNTNKIVNLNLKSFFNVVYNVKNYKNFLPWCVDSWEQHHEIIKLKSQNIASNDKHHSHQNDLNYLKKYDYLSLIKIDASQVESHLKHKKLNNKNNNEIHNEKIIPEEHDIHLKKYKGGIKVGFDFLDFSYVSQVRCISPNLIISTVDKDQTTVFEHLESVWKLKQVNTNNIEIQYNIEFKYKSKIYSNFTSLFLNFLGENIVTSFIKQCEKEENLLALHKDKSNKTIKEVANIDNYINSTFLNFKSNNNDNDKFVAIFKNIVIVKVIEENELIKLISKVKESYIIQQKFLIYKDIIDWKDSYQVKKFLNDL